MHESKRILPWQSSFDWLHLYELVTSSLDNDTKRRLIETISVWEYKSSKVPIAVSCTKLFLVAALADAKKQPPEQLVLIYAMAIVRFVNSHVDTEQTQHYVRSISEAASQLKIPSEIVNCRHRIAHQDIPSLELVRHTASLCWEYLLTHYWHPQAKSLKACVSAMENSKLLTLNLVEFLKDVEAATFPACSDCDSAVFETLCFTAVLLSHHRQRKPALRVLKKACLHESLLSNPQCGKFVAWCQTIRNLLPQYLSSLEQHLDQCVQQQEVMLSYLRDFVLLVVHPNANCAVTLSVFWILSKLPPDFTVKLIHSLMYKICGIDPQSSLFTPKFNSSQPQPFIVCSDDSSVADDVYLPSQNAEWPQDVGAESSNVVASSSDFSSSDSDDRFESFLLWFKAVYPYFDDQMEADLHQFYHHPFETRYHYLEWIQCLLLFPVSTVYEKTMASQLCEKLYPRFHFSAEVSSLARYFISPKKAAVLSASNQSFSLRASSGSKTASMHCDQAGHPHVKRSGSPSLSGSSMIGSLASGSSSCSPLLPLVIQFINRLYCDKLSTQKSHGAGFSEFAVHTPLSIHSSKHARFVRQLICALNCVQNRVTNCWQVLSKEVVIHAFQRLIRMSNYDEQEIFLQRKLTRLLNSSSSPFNPKHRVLDWFLFYLKTCSASLAGHGSHHLSPASAHSLSLQAKFFEKDKGGLAQLKQIFHLTDEDLMLDQQALFPAHIATTESGVKHLNPACDVTFTSPGTMAPLSKSSSLKERKPRGSSSSLLQKIQDSLKKLHAKNRGNGVIPSSPLLAGSESGPVLTDFTADSTSRLNALRKRRMSLPSLTQKRQRQVPGAHPSKSCPIAPCRLGRDDDDLDIC